jgi:hypothetical protein
MTHSENEQYPPHKTNASDIRKWKANPERKLITETDIPDLAVRPRNLNLTVPFSDIEYYPRPP